MKILNRFGVAIFLCASLVSQAQGGKVFDNLTMESKILKMERKYAIYLPPDYETSERSYPVLFLLHGSGDNQTGWVQFGEVKRITDKAIANGDATAMIIVMPSAEEGRRGYFNSLDGKWRYEDFFFDEFIPYIEGKYRIKSKKQYRAIAGLSMGGGGTFMYALHHPEYFSSACPLSAQVGALNFDAFKRKMGSQLDGIGETEAKQYYHNHFAPALLKAVDLKQIKSVRWYIDCGDDDFLYEGNCMMHLAMRKMEIPHEYRVRDGRHGWKYWRDALPEVLKFVTHAYIK